MRCVMCKQADVEAGTATVTLERGRVTLVVKHVAARVCPNCGEEYVDEDTATEPWQTMDQAESAGVQVDVGSTPLHEHSTP